MNEKKLCFALLAILSAVLIVGCTSISRTHLDLHKAENEALDLHLDAINNHAEILEEQRKKIKALETQAKAWKAENNE